MEEVCPGEPKREVNPPDFTLKTKKLKLFLNTEKNRKVQIAKKSKNWLFLKESWVSVLALFR